MSVHRPLPSRRLVLTFGVACAAALPGSLASAQSVDLGTAFRQVQANANVLSSADVGPWSQGVSSGSTTASQNSNIDPNVLSVSGGLHAHWPAGNTASTDYTVDFTVPAGMSYSLTGTMSAVVSSFAFAGPGWSKLTLTGPGGSVFSYVIEAFTGSPSFFNLAASGPLPPGAYTLHFDASGQGFGSSIMTSGVSDADWNITLELIGVCGDGGSGSCFAVHADPTCSDANCCGAVCSIDPFCCQVAWDGICVGEAGSLCAAPCPADLDASGAVDAADLAVRLGQWGSAGSADLNASGTVDAADLAVLLGAWGSC